MFDLTERVAIVTGGSRGIGRAICRRLAQAGAYVVVNFQGNEEAAAQTLAGVKDAGGDGELRRFDVSSAEDADAAIAGVAKERGKVDILVNNAGIARDQLLLRVSEDDLHRTWATNLNGAILCSKAAVRLMMRKKHGRVVNLSSVVAESGNPGQSVYAASKAGLIGLTKTLAREYATRGITVNAVAPGFIETDMTAGLPDEARKVFLEQTPLGRAGTVDDVAAAVHYLVSDEASFVTGQVLRINGGMYV